jgi:DNA-binding SARP family transcriptional activator
LSDGTDDAAKAPLEARLWGEPRFLHRGVKVRPASAKALALLAYLVTQERPVARDELATLLWGPGRLANVRQALYQLRTLPGAREWLVDGGPKITVLAVSDIEGLEVAADDAPLETVGALEGEEFLAGVGDGLPDPYLDWLEGERARTADLVRGALSVSAAALEGAGDVQSALALVNRLRDLDPYDGSAERSAMRLTYLAGEADKALAGYARFAARLKGELGSEPDPQTKALARKIERGEALAPTLTPAALSDAERRIVQALALARGALKVDGLARVLERPAFDLAADLAKLESRGCVDGHLSVSPGLRDEVLKGLPAALGRLLHERIATVMLAENAADQGALARHLLAAGEHVEAARRGLKAAHEALERGRQTDAVDLLYLTLWASANEPGLRLEACLSLEGIAAGRADFGLQEALLAEVERLAWESQSDSALAEANVRRARLLLAQRNVGAAVECALTALRVALRIGDTGLVARSRNVVGAAHFFAGDLDGAAQSFTYNLEAVDEVERYRAHNNLGSIHALRGDLDASHRHFDEALTLARRNANHLDVSATLNNLAASAERLGDYPRAEKHLREGLALARHKGGGRHEAEMLVNLAVVYARQGQLGPAWNTTEEVGLLAAELGDERLAMRVAEQRAEILTQCGDLEAAVAGFDSALAVAGELGDERKLLALGAQQLLVRARLEPTLMPEAAAAATELERARLHGMVSWLRLELALFAADLSFSADQLALVGAAGTTGVHQELVGEIVRLRLGLLRGADAAVLAASEEALWRLVGAGLIPPTKVCGTEVTSRPERVTIVEQPLALFLARALEAVLEGRATGATPAPVDAAVAVQLEEQAAGLPARLRRTLLQAPLRWHSGLLSLPAAERQEP